MSETWHIACKETKEEVWIGQGDGAMFNLYSESKDTMELLRRFLNKTQGKELVFICGNEIDDKEYVEFN